MRTFYAVLKSTYLRLVPRIVSTAVYSALTLCMVFVAVYMTRAQQVKARVVLVAASASDAPDLSSALDVTVLAEKPPRSDLVEQQYDAYVTVDSAGNYQIETLRNDDFKTMLLVLLKTPNADLSGAKTERGVGVNIIGFMMMFLLMVSFSNLFGFADDKEKGQLRRIVAAPTSFGWYLGAHCVFCLSLLLPEYLLLVVLKLCGWDLGFSLLQYAGLMAALACLGISLALFLNTLIKKPDNASMLGNSILVLTSVLSGSFYSFGKNSAALDAVTKVLPQKGTDGFCAGPAKRLGTFAHGVHPLCRRLFTCPVRRLLCHSAEDVREKSVTRLTALAKQNVWE